MARIRPYEQQVSAQGDLPSRSAQPSDFGGTGLSNLGVGITNVGESAGQIQRFMNEAKAAREVTDAQTKMLQEDNDLHMTIDRMHREWKPGDPYLSEVVPGIIKQRLENLGYDKEGNQVYETQAGAGTFARLSERMQLRLGETLRHVDADLAGKAAIINHKKLVDDTGNFLYTHPSWFEIRRGEVVDAIMNDRGEYAKIPYVEREKLARAAEEQLAVNAVEGFIRKAPNLALEVLQDPTLKQDDTYGWIAKYIPNEKHEPLTMKAKTAVHALEVEARQAEEERRRQQQELYHTTDTSLMAKYAAHRANSQNPNLTAFDVYDAMATNRLDGRTGAALINMLDGDAAHGGKVKTDPATEHWLFQRIHKPYGSKEKLLDPVPIYDAFTNGKLSWESMTHLRKEFDDSRSEEGSKLGEAKNTFLQGQKHKIDKSNPLLGKIDQDGAEQFSNFTYFVNQEVDRMRKENKDPHALFDPSSPDYAGKHTERFQIPMSESIRKFGESLHKQPGLPKTPSGAVPDEKQRKPGETPAEWYKRTH